MNSSRVKNQFLVSYLNYNLGADQNHMLSVFMLVYNQEGFISQTLESILHQKTSFPFNLVIGEDCSTDNTRAIIEAYKKQYPDKIKVISSSQNLGLINNFIRTVNHCDGKYIAICDGDDFWTDEHKLQMQVDFLENNSDYSIAFTRKQDVLPNGTISAYQPANPDTSNFTDLINGNYIPSVTAVFRNKVNGALAIKWLHKYPYGDWPLYLYTVSDGSKIKFIDTITAAYRKDIGVSAKVRKSKTGIIQVNLSILKDLYDDQAFEKYRAIIQKSLRNHQIKYMLTLVGEDQFLKSIKLFLSLLLKVNPIKLTKSYLFSLKKRCTRSRV
jgi:glycosyltransferase involved in cell wall biosynthesis|tara:strand:- start:58925 stop:59905 length:981 start_codon:yes stop_codon:yes gene_type:complete